MGESNRIKLEVLRMKPIKLVGLALLSGGLIAGLAGTASAQSFGSEKPGYVETNTQGFGTAKLTYVNDRDRNGRWNGNNRGNRDDWRGHNNRRDDHRGNRHKKKKSKNTKLITGTAE